MKIKLKTWPSCYFFYWCWRLGWLWPTIVSLFLCCWADWLTDWLTIMMTLTLAVLWMLCCYSCCCCCCRAFELADELNYRELIFSTNCVVCRRLGRSLVILLAFSLSCTGDFLPFQSVYCFNDFFLSFFLPILLLVRYRRQCLVLNCGLFCRWLVAVLVVTLVMAVLF